MERAGDKLGRHPTQSLKQNGKGKQDLNHLITAFASKANKKMTRRQRQPRAKSGTETSLGTTAAAAAKSEIVKGDKLERQGGSGRQKRNYEGRRGRGLLCKRMLRTSMAAVVSGMHEIMAPSDTSNHLASQPNFITQGSWQQSEPKKHPKVLQYISHSRRFSFPTCFHCGFNRRTFGAVKTLTTQFCDTPYPEFLLKAPVMR